MSRTRGQIDSIQRTVQKTEEWLDDLAAELGTEDERYAWRVLRAYLQVLRDRLTDATQAAAVAALGSRVLRRHVSVGEVNDVLSQLPAEIRDVLERA